MEEKKKWIRTPAANQAQYRYNAKNIKRIPLDVQITEYERIKAAAKAAGETVNGYIKAAIRERMGTDARNAVPAADQPVEDQPAEDQTEAAAEMDAEATEKPQKAIKQRQPIRIS